MIVGYWLYSLVRNAIPNQENIATQRAEQVYGWERAVRIDIELAVNLAIDRITWLIVGMNYYYAVAHFIVTVGVLIWLYLARPTRYRPARTVFLLANTIALAIFYLFPLAPPRLLPHHGYVDTVVVHGTWGSWASGDVAAATNQYAAMPSMHFAWSLWCAIVVFLLVRRWWVRALAVAHPTLTLVVIVATGNHFLLDAVGGVLALALGFAVARMFAGAWHRFRPQRWRAGQEEPAAEPAGAALSATALSATVGSATVGSATVGSATALSATVGSPAGDPSRVLETPHTRS